MAGLQFSFTGNNGNLLKNIAQVQQALAVVQKEVETNGENFQRFFAESAKGGIDLTKALAGDSKEMKKLAESMKLSLNEMKEAWENLTEDMKSSGLGVVYGKALKDAEAMTDQVTQAMANNGGQVRNTSKDWNGLNVQMQMLAREVPNLANSFQIFLMSIGNNLPMLAEELGKAQEEVNEMKKAGKQFTPVWRQALGALLNWQSGLIIGITLLTAYGDKIPELIEKIFGMNTALKSTAEMQEAINESLTKDTGNYGKQVTELKKLQSGWAALGGDLAKQKKYIIENKDAFDDLGVSVKSVADAENLLVNNTDAFIKSLQARTQAQAAANLATEEYEKAYKKQIEAEAMPETVKKFKTTGRDSEGALQGEWVEVTNEERTAALEAAKAIEEQGNAYSKLGETKSKEAAKILKDAGIKDAENKALEEEKKRLEELQQAKDAYLQKLGEYEQARKDAITKGEKAATDAMEEGYQKQLAQMEAAHKAEMNALDKEKSDLLKKKIEAAEAQAKAEGKSFKASNVQLSTDEEQIFTDRQKAATAKQKAEIQAFYDTLAKMQQAAAVENASQLEKQLFDIDTYYQEQIKKAEGFEELKTQLTKNWATERAKAENEARLRANQQGENSALMDIDLQYQGTGLTERAEQEKTQILIKYAQERIEILKALGDEQSQAEAESLEKQIEAYNKQLKQPMSVKGWFDSKIFDKLKNKYLELGDTEEEAKEKASGFFVGVQSGASKTAEAVGYLQTAFGGLDEGLDQVLGAVGSVANGFASGGLIGGISAAAGVAIGAISKLGAADYADYNRLKEEYDSLIDVWDTLITKKMEYVSIEYGDEARKAADEAEAAAKKQIEAYRTLGKERLKSGAGWFTHSIGVRQNERMGQNEWNEVKKALGYTGLNAIKNNPKSGLFDLTIEQLEKLQEVAPTFWAKLDGDVRDYLNKIIEANEEIKDMQEQVSETFTNVSFDSFYDGFISTLTDMESDTEDFAEDFGNYLKNAIMQNIVANKYKGQIQSLYDSWVSMSDSDKNGVFDLTAGETADLQAAQKALADAMIAERDALADTFGWATGSYSQEASKGAFSAMSQETGNELNGRFAAFQISNENISGNTKLISEGINVVLTYMPKFEYVMNDILTQHSLTNGYLDDIARHTKTIKDFGDILQKIADNTSRL